MENNTDKIVKDLIDLNPDNDLNNDLNNDSNIESDSETNKISREKQEKNKKICRLLKKFIKNFYDNIHIPYHFFKENKWNISKTLNNNEDVLFYNEEFLISLNSDRFYEVFDKYILLMDDIFYPKNTLNLFLKKISKINIDDNNIAKYLINIFNNKKYRFISPEYVINKYFDYKNNSNNEHDIRTQLNDHLNEIMDKVRNHVKNFKMVYHEMLSHFISERPMDQDLQKNYVLNFIGSVLISIFDFCEKIIELNIYAFHPIVLNIIESTLPLDDIFLHEPEKYKNKIMIVV
ncbi:hypothetical protein [Powai lake megavirus]|uniref:Uncharacterized protein n=1 Tax=Powai lake megavirus TaxID=1842663 RepID=A0A167RI08_9VIRU|nr:hypothetical protein QJ849_gp546 [Powai lake megavirus]ANB50708.1 hypothetical protein [Powai lake megavirus]